MIIKIFLKLFIGNIVRTFNQIYEALDTHKMNDDQLSTYIEKMNKGLVDKLFFMDHIPDYDLLVDFGCADGSLIKAAVPYEPDATYIGYDISEQMLEKAGKGQDKIIFTSNWKLVEEKLRQSKTSIIVLNSLIHEIYSYASLKEEKEFWARVFRSGFTYIAIRDMMMREKDFNKKIQSEHLEEILTELREKDNGEEKVDSFEKVFGPITTEGELIHLLMKWNYWDNWDREVHEDYLGIKVENFFKKLNSVGRGLYEVKYWQPFTLQYLKNYVLDLIDYEIKSTTHIKVLMKQKFK